MNCPACNNKLHVVNVSGVELDICKDGCGGIWFDNREIKKFDEQHEIVTDEMLLVEPKVKVDVSVKRKCPRCKDVTMNQHFFSVKREVSVDECPQCGGVWLDAGELKTIRSQYKDEKEREERADMYFNDIFSSDMKKTRKESLRKTEKAQRFAKMFRFICPSNYIKGKQDWGAF